MADQAITALPKKTYSGSSQIASTDYLLGIDSAEGYQMLIQDLGEYIINRATASLAGSTQTLASAISALNSNGLYDRGGLINNVDLNTYKTPGLYYCSSTGGSNFPTGMSYSAVLVEVSLFANGGGVCQVCIDAVGSSKRIWRRYFVNNSWSAWVKQPERDEIDRLALYNTANNVGFELPSSKAYIKIKLLNSGGTGAEVTIDRDGNVTFAAIE